MLQLLGSLAKIQDNPKEQFLRPQRGHQNQVHCACYFPVQVRLRYYVSPRNVGLSVEGVLLAPWLLPRLDLTQRQEDMHHLVTTSLV